MTVPPMLNSPRPCSLTPARRHPHDAVDAMGRRMTDGEEQVTKGSAAPSRRCEEPGSSTCSAAGCGI